MLTLGAAPMVGTLPSGVSAAWTAAWCRQGKGTSLVTERGVIARLADGSTVHARDLTHARKLAAARVRAIRPGDGAQRAAGIDRWTAAELAVEIRAADSIRAGNCPSGTADWIARHFAGRDVATVGDVLRSAFATSDRVRFAVAACLAAVRAARRAAA
jgi:hypothetical protein